MDEPITLKRSELHGPDPRSKVFMVKYRFPAEMLMLVRAFTREEAEQLAENALDANVEVPSDKRPFFAPSQTGKVNGWLLYQDPDDAPEKVVIDTTNSPSVDIGTLMGWKEKRQ